MTHTEESLQAISSLDGRYRDRLKNLGTMVSEGALIGYRIQVEALWLLHLAEVPLIGADLPLNPAIKAALIEWSNNPPPAAAKAVKNHEMKTNHDVKAVEYWLRDRLRELGAEEKTLAFIHFGCTSEDINNVAYALMLQKVNEQVLIPALNRIILTLREKTGDYADLAMLSRTHGQPASPTTMGKELSVFGMRLLRETDSLMGLPIPAKMNGAVGNYNAMAEAYPEVNWVEVSRSFIARQGLTPNLYTTQIENHDGMVILCDNLRRINTILLGFCRDMWSYIGLGYFKLKVKADEVGSSTMPHKVNPIDFENAEGNLGLAISLSQHFAEKLPISRWQRDLSDSTVQRSLGAMFGHMVLAYDSLLKGLSKVDVDEARMAADLDQSWEVLGEAVQTVLRRYGVSDAYEQLKAASRGKSFGAKEYAAFVQSTSLPKEEKDRLLQLTPATYLGRAVQLAKAFADNAATDTL